MRRARSRVSRPRLGSGIRRLASFYLLGFLLAVAAAPHHHLNSLDDLLSDAPSDSGFFVETPSVDPAAQNQMDPERLVDDDPCLACFHHDYASAARPLFVLDSASTALREIPVSPFAGLVQRSSPPPLPPPRAV